MADLSAGVAAALDQGTQSTRFLLFDKNGHLVCSSAVPLVNTHPKPGWTEQDPLEIWNTVQMATRDCLSLAQEKYGITTESIKCLGITNQRETTVLWSRSTGLPLHPAIVWNDTRSESVCESLISRYGAKDYFQKKCGLPIASYFSAMKLKWLMENVPAVKEAINKKDCLFGTVDTWILWNLSNGKIHATDTTNASRTMLMNLESLKWDLSICHDLEIPDHILPTIVDSVGVLHHLEENILDGKLTGVPLAGILGDQQAALLGQGCVRTGSMKNTYGTGSFCLASTGEKPIFSNRGILTTVGFSSLKRSFIEKQKEGEEGEERYCMYALEGSVATSGAALSWAVDNLEMASSSADLCEKASQVPDSGGMYFVPAFSGLFAPYWRGDARGVAVGLTQYVTKAHFLRAIVEASAFQTYDMIQEMTANHSIDVESLRADGGLSQSDVLLQKQADLLSIPVIRPREKEATGLGAAIAAGLSIGFYSKDQITSLNPPSEVFAPNVSEQQRLKDISGWRKAVDRSFNWVE